MQVDAQAHKDYSSSWTPQEFADRLWAVHLRFFPVVRPCEAVGGSKLARCVAFGVNSSTSGSVTCLPQCQTQRVCSAYKHRPPFVA